MKDFFIKFILIYERDNSVLNSFFFRIAMEEKRTVMLVLMLCLVVGMLVGQSQARDPKFDKCFRDCYANCLSVTVTSGLLRKTCSKCTRKCEFKVQKKACILIWCWNVKWCRNGTGDMISVGTTYTSKKKKRNKSYNAINRIK